MKPHFFTAFNQLPIRRELASARAKLLNPGNQHRTGKRSCTDKDVKEMMIMRENKVSWEDIAAAFESTKAAVRKQVLRWGPAIKEHVREAARKRDRYPVQHLSPVGAPIPPASGEAVVAAAAADGSRSLLIAVLRYGSQGRHYGHLSISPAQCRARLKVMGHSA